MDGERISDHKVLLAMGPWTGEAVGQWLGTPLPVFPLKDQILRLESRGGRLLFDLHRMGVSVYISSKPNWLIWVGTTEERVGFDDRPSQEAKELILRSATKLIPDLSGDDLPILG